MKTATTRKPGNGSMRTRSANALGLALAIACILTTPPLRAEDAHRAEQQHSQGHAPQQVYRHEDRHHSDNYHNQDYAYGAPPVVYAPAVVPGISLFLPL
jgi:hypothetical protein